MPRISIIIAAYNRAADSKKCLDSVLRHINSPNVEVIFINNGSHDETSSMLAEYQHPQLKVIHLHRNVGFASANNIGCRMALGDYMILLNNDTIVPEGWMHRLIQPLMSNDSLGLVGPVSNFVGNDQRLELAVCNPETGADDAFLQEFYSQYRGQIRETTNLSFYCVAMKREVYERVGELDTRFGMGMFEDDDYCMRVRQYGYRIAVVEDAFVYHQGSASFKEISSDMKERLFLHNQRYFERKWNRPWQPHPMPINLFNDSYSPARVAKVLAESNVPTVLFLGEPAWMNIDEQLERLKLKYPQTKPLIIAHVQQYRDIPIQDIRKLGPSLYLTNRLDLLEQARFNLVVYAGYTQRTSIQADKYEIARDAYTHDGFLSLMDQLNGTTGLVHIAANR